MPMLCTARAAVSSRWKLGAARGLWVISGADTHPWPATWTYGIAVDGVLAIRCPSALRIEPRGLLVPLKEWDVPGDWPEGGEMDELILAGIAAYKLLELTP